MFTVDSNKKNLFSFKLCVFFFSWFLLRKAFEFKDLFIYLYLVAEKKNEERNAYLNSTIGNV